MTVNMTNPYWWEAHDDLQSELGREPTYEEVLDELNRRFGSENKVEDKENKQGIFRQIRNHLSLGWIIYMSLILIFLIYQLFSNPTETIHFILATIGFWTVVEIVKKPIKKKFNQWRKS